MRLRKSHAAPEAFGLSFLDVAFCALGGTLFLLLLLLHRHQRDVVDFYALLNHQGKSAQETVSTLAQENQRLREEMTQASGKFAALHQEQETRLAQAEGEIRRTEQMRQAEQAAQDERFAKAQANSAAQIAAERETAAAERRKLTAEREKTAAAEAKLGTLLTARQQGAAEQAALEAELRSLRSQVAGAIGLKGPLKRVAFVFDTSQSLGDATNSALYRDQREALDRFSEYQSLLSHWIRTLPFERFSVLEFNHDPAAPPGWKGQLMDGSPSSREAAVRFVAGWKPQGSTNTIAALKQALALPNIDTIILFSDGAPNGADGLPVDPNDDPMCRAAADWVLAELKQANSAARGASRVVINTVATGDYLSAVYGKFLRDLARDHGGEFIGR